ncbi:hypothetical protein AB0I89_12145 [Micromonospora sp. NPDC049801]|uniref:hypothetical protein n=1 Tax=unclassified Micromonospora TaxID=2617518 RepID=UPI0033D73F16
MTQTSMLSQHHDLDTYVRELADPDSFPVLRSRSAPVDVTSLGTPDRSRPVADLRVVCVSASPVARVAEALAARFGGTVIALPAGGLGEHLVLDDQAAHVLVIALADEVSVDDALAVVDRVNAYRDRPGGRVPRLGFLTAGDLDQLSWLILKNLASGHREPASRKHVFLSPFPNGPLLSAGALVLSGAQVTRESVHQAVVAGSATFLSITSSGREHAVLLNDTVLCGSDHESRRQWLELGTGGGAPHCAFEGTCFLPGVSLDDVIEARSVRAEVVFTNSCLSWRPHSGRAPRQFLLTNALSSGYAAAAIGPMFPSHTTDWATETFHRLCDAGVPLGEVVAALNGRARETGTELPYFALLGFPWLVAGGVAPADEATLRRWEADAARSAEPDVAPAATAPASGSGTAATPQQLLRSLLDLGLNSTALETCVAELEARSVPDPDLLARAQMAAAAELIDYTSATYSGFDSIWEPVLATRTHASRTPCPYCDATVEELVGTSPDRPWTSRTAAFCHRCSHVWDAPADPQLQVPLIDIPEVWHRGEDVRGTVRLRPGADGWRTDRLTVGWFLHGQYFQGVDVPDPGEVRVTPGSTDDVLLSAQMHVNNDAFPYHQHFCRVIVIASGAVHLGGRAFAIVPEER